MSAYNVCMKKFGEMIVDLVLVLVVAFVAVIAFLWGEKNNVMASNSEYNGTIYAGDKTSKNVSLMINVYWGNEYLENMLEVLKKHNVKTTFFVGGSWAKENVSLLKKIYDDGHEIASHGTNHKEHGKISYQQNLTEIQTCHEIVKHILKIDMELFAPPGGSYGKNTTKAAEFLGYKTIMWTRDTIDWRDKNEDLIYQRALTNLCGGDLVLMHPTLCTAAVFEKIVMQIKKQGFNVVPVSQTLGL